MSLFLLLGSVITALAAPDALVILPLDEGSGLVASDLSGMGNNGTLVNGVLYVADTADGSPFAARFDGTDDFIDLGVIDVNGPGLTLATWFKADSFPGPSNDPRLISKASSTAANDHLFMLSTIRVGTAVRLRARVRIGGLTTTLIASTGDLLAGIWQHAAVTYEGTTLRLYFDGVEVGSTSLSGAVDLDPAVPVAVGAQPAGAGERFFDGLLDDVRILQRALGAEEISDIVAGAGGNQSPLAADDGYTTPEDVALVVDAATGVLSNDTDPDLDPLQAVLVGDVSYGALTLNAEGSFTYAPAANFSGTDSFTYRANDGSAISNLATVTLRVNALNDAPVARGDGYQTPPDTLLTVTAARGVLANDSDPDLDVLQAILVSGTANGLLILNIDGSFAYTPDGGFSGQDSFTYRARDSLLDSNLTTVTISVDMAPVVNRSPRIVSGTIGFIKQVVDSSVGETHFVGAAELTGDHELDLIATDYVDGALLLYQNDGHGGFLPSVLDADLAGAYPAHLDDLDADGDTDVLAGGYLADTFVWYENLGTGVFVRRDIDSATDGPHSIVTQDMDGDSDVDLVTSSQDANNIVWYENDGAQNFTPHLIDNTADGAKRAEVADIDGDGDLDVVSASFFSDEIAWHQNDGALNFTKQIIDSSADGAYYVSLADVDGDADIDLFSASQLNNRIAWYRNDGLGNFVASTMDSGAAGARTVIAADIDGDGDVDALTASVNDDTIAWFKNDGSGGFTKQGIDLEALGAYGVYAVDMDHDGDIDVLSASRDANAVAYYTQIHTHAAAVDLGGPLVIDSGYLLTIDPDDGPAELTYMISRVPDFGDLLFDGVPVALGGTFTQADVDNGRLSYLHTGLDETADSFSFMVADGGENGVQAVTSSFMLNLGYAGSLTVLPLDEGSGTLAVDASGSLNDGRLVNGATFEAYSGDDSASAVRFDGVDDFIDLGPLDVNGAGLTLATWFNAESFPGVSNDPRLIAKATGIAADDHLFMLGTIREGSTVRLRARLRVGGTTTTLIAGSGDLTTGVWRHAAMTYDGLMFRLYLDGVAVGSALLHGGLDLDSTVPVAVGGQPPGAGIRYFDGLIDDVRILARPLSAIEINQIVRGEY